MKILPGIYRHYKWNTYEVIGEWRDTERLEEVVIYRALYDSEDFGNEALWVRPKAMFLECVLHNGQEVLRFQKLED